MNSLRSLIAFIDLTMVPQILTTWVWDPETGEILLRVAREIREALSVAADPEASVETLKVACIKLQVLERQLTFMKQRVDEARLRALKEREDEFREVMAGCEDVWSGSLGSHDVH